MITQLSSLDFDKAYTYADYLMWQFEERVELIRGRVFPMSPAPGRRHQEISTMLQGHFFNALQDQNTYKLYAAPFDVRFPKAEQDSAKAEHVVQPDICVVCQPDKLDDRGCNGAPDLIIEILSPGNTKKEMQLKYALYEEFGVTEYWVVFPPEEMIMQFVIGDDAKYHLHRTFNTGDTASSYQFPNIQLDLDRLFEWE